MKLIQSFTEWYSESQTGEILIDWESFASYIIWIANTDTSDIGRKTKFKRGKHEYNLLY